MHTRVASSNIESRIHFNKILIRLLIAFKYTSM